MRHRKPLLGKPRGEISVFDVLASGLWRHRFSQANSIQFDWARIACQTIAKGQVAYKIGAMYLEFENVASPGDPVSAPSFSQTEGREYYESLSGNRDYLRVSLLGFPVLGVSSDLAEVFSGEGIDCNQATFFAQSSGVAGVNSLEFSNDANSTVFGIALVAAPTWEDRSQDLIYGRAYYQVANQILKEASHQIGVSWTQIFG